MDTLKLIRVQNPPSERFHSSEPNLDLFDHACVLQEVQLDRLMAERHQNVIEHDVLLVVVGRDCERVYQTVEELLIIWVLSELFEWN